MAVLELKREESILHDTPSEKLHPLVEHAVQFTETYKKYSDEQKAVREAMCIKTMYPAFLQKLRSTDVFAGLRGDTPIAVFTHQEWKDMPGRHIEGKQSGYVFDFAAPYQACYTQEEKEILKNLADYWIHECDNARYRSKWDDELKAYTFMGFRGVDNKGRGKISSGGSTGCSMVLDYTRLVSGGLPGLYANVHERRKRAQENSDNMDFYDGLVHLLDTVRDVCLDYAHQAEQLADRTSNERIAENMMGLKDILIAITKRAPETLREALQLAWIYALVNYDFPEVARFDEVFAPYFQHDIENGILSELEAEELLLAFWKPIEEKGAPVADRIVVGGLGRKNEAWEDRLALAVLRTIPRHGKLTPQFTFRYHKEQDPVLFDAAIDAVSQGCIFPLIYNDDTVVPGVMKHFNVPFETALKYHPHGCGEFTLPGMSPTPITVGYYIVNCLQAALRNGRNSFGDIIGLETGYASDFKTFEDLYKAFEIQLAFGARLGAKNLNLQYKTHNEKFSFLAAALLMDDCLERGKAPLDGGLRYMGGVLVGHGYANTSDSLYAIRELVYEKKVLRLGDLVDILDNDFNEYEDVRKTLLDLPKFGNDNDAVDAMFCRVWESVHQASKKAGNDAGLHFLGVSSVNPGAYAMGFQSGASPDGRRCGDPYAVGTVPITGMDKNGFTALLNSIAKASAENGGSTSNMKLSKTFLQNNRELFKTALEVYFSTGGQQATITAVNAEDLQNALKHPEQYENLYVRVGGLCAKFVELDSVRQQDIINRTLHS